MTLTTLIILTILHWIAAYGICYQLYNPNDTESGKGFGSLWIPVIGWLFIWLIVIFSVIAYLDSPNFKALFYRKKGSK
jgi:hypothetical protein